MGVNIRGQAYANGVSAYSLGLAPSASEGANPRERFVKINRRAFDADRRHGKIEADDWRADRVEPASSTSNVTTNQTLAGSFRDGSQGSLAKLGNPGLLL